MAPSPSASLSWKPRMIHTAPRSASASFCYRTSNRALGTPFFQNTNKNTLSFSFLKTNSSLLSWGVSSILFISSPIGPHYTHQLRFTCDTRNESENPEMSAIFFTLYGSPSLLSPSFKITKIEPFYSLFYTANTMHTATPRGTDNQLDTYEIIHALDHFSDSDDDHSDNIALLYWAFHRLRVFH